MRKVWIIFYTALVLISCSENKRINKENTNFRNEKTYEINSQEPFTGILEYTYPNGKIEAEFYLKNGVDTGEYTLYFENGQIKQKAEIKQGNIVLSYFGKNGEKLDHPFEEKDLPIDEFELEFEF